ncbi:TniQ family protein [Brevibacillus centrosporus]|uniref:TniQ family protein n=1 Tax=Brevibacillus centrosporus TaxID=54910 RepID=UPI003B02955E
MENTIFTVRPNPRTGESLWGFLLRLASENGIPLLSIINRIKQWDRKYVQRADLNLLDIAPGSILNIEQLSNLTGQSIERLFEATLAPLMKTFGVNQEIQRARFLSGMILDTYRFCPECLNEKLYYRLLWKMTPVTACIQHDVSLVNGCPSCKKQINFLNVELLGVCPHCGFLLLRSQARPINDSQRERQHWINEALLVLTESKNYHVKPHEIAMRLLYLQCGRQSYFDRHLKEAAVKSGLPTLLQHARESLSQKRILHLSFLLNTLYEHHYSMNEFFAITVPDSFVDSVRQGAIRRTDQLSCLAPWCNRYQRPGTLVKTGTTSKKRKSGKVLLYYLACTECGCEYAIDEDGELQERTYFIEGYQALRTVSIPLTKIKLLASNLGFTEDKTRRCLAYFCTRIESYALNGARMEFDTSLLNQVINNIRKGTMLKVIRQWDCWGELSAISRLSLSPRGYAYAWMIYMKRWNPICYPTLPLLSHLVQHIICLEYNVPYSGELPLGLRHISMNKLYGTTGVSKM